MLVNALCQHVASSAKVINNVVFNSNGISVAIMIVCINENSIIRRTG
ncbi:hypothetical protein LTSEHVI_4948 [Salmonella enterica subsp. enterica serovar Hvittingfoss str. A4-620]|nr:hypothetical protein LTSEHVI_4948 [Salmonella enterica subsp. enterica serovar Hvittingfoss str. A4-620]